MPTSPTSPGQTPKSATYTRSSLGLFSNTGDGMGGGGGATSPRSAGQQRNATTIGTTTVGSTVAQVAGMDAGDRQQDGDAAAHAQPERRRASRRQSEDTMRAMRSLDRQYGRRRRLNSDYPRADAPMLAPDGSQRSTSGRTAPRSPPGASNSRVRQPLRRGDSRALFAPLLCLPQAETVLAVNVSPSYASAGDSVAAPLQSPAAGAMMMGGGGSARLARQLMMIAGRLAQGGGASLESVQGAVRPRASMPLINGAHRPLQRNRSHVARRTRDELSDALTMKSVEIRGGRIVLDDPSSSEESGGSESYASSDDGGESSAAAARIFGRRQQQRGRLGSVASNGVLLGRRPSVGSSAGTSAVEWEEDDLRRRWYTRRCLASRAPFGSVHRLVRAEHGSEAPQPLLNDLRR
ncbi:hypothetical protein H4S07_004793, partial [Coemansia furcata]